MTYLDILKQYWGYNGFRGIQEQIIESIGQGRDTLGLMPTGGGKSITFQVPTLAMEGVCLVITPLIALMKDQVRNLREHDIKAAAIHTGMKREEIITVMGQSAVLRAGLRSAKFFRLMPATDTPRASSFAPTAWPILPYPSMTAFVPATSEQNGLSVARGHRTPPRWKS